ncbi:DUF6507 family protein [Streptomyces alboflavus]|uniref:DUF6507 family protein n=1 Tax=Streptomyces alboflavus TaxID=67267 RepID=UPI000F65692A|nr:DUF6507 family protein [Streptomyces alboflavus]
MTAWDIDPAGVRGVLEKAGDAAKGLSSAGSTAQKTLPGAAKHAGTAVEGGEKGDGTQGPVAAALGQFFTKWEGDLLYVAGRAGSSLNGAAEATVAYHQGDLQMAADAQANALKEPDIDMPGQKAGKGGRG